MRQSASYYARTLYVNVFTPLEEKKKKNDSLKKYDDRDLIALNIFAPELKETKSSTLENVSKAI